MRANPYLPILFFLLANWSGVVAQQMPFLNNYAWNAALFNPAAQGAGNTGQIMAVYRSQFQQLETSVRPTTYLLHADLSPLVGERIGIGAQVLGDKTHLFSRFQFNGFFGYHLVRQPNFRFSLGASAGFFSQALDFTGRRVADVLDLAVFNDNMQATRFDGGPGLALEYKTANGSVLALDASATQLFSSAIKIEGTGNAGATYNLLPHLLINARYRYQGDGFSVEPTAAIRIISGVNSGLFDFNLNGYFLKNDLLMAGVGYRTDQGGVRFQLGVAPTPAFQLIASADLHQALGATYEVGIRYVFGKGTPEPAYSAAPPTALPIAPEPTINLVQDEYADIQALAQTLDNPTATIHERHNRTKTVLETPAQWPQEQSAAADTCAVILAENDMDIRQIRQIANGINIKRLQAEQVVRTASTQGAQISDETRATLQAINERSAEVNSLIEALIRTQGTLTEQCAGMRPQHNETTCIRAGDADCVQEFFTTSLNRSSGLPNNLFPLRAFVFPGAAAVQYSYPDDEELYTVSPELAALMRHISAQIKHVEQQGARLDNITLTTELQEDKHTLDYELGLLYDGILGNNPIAYTLIDNETGTTLNQTMSLSVGNPISLEALGALKIASLRAFLIRQGIPAARITLQLRFNHTDNIYREETRVMVKFRG